MTEEQTKRLKEVADACTRALTDWSQECIALEVQRLRVDGAYRLYLEAKRKYEVETVLAIAGRGDYGQSA